jgi:hypothetical protein
VSANGWGHLEDLNQGDRFRMRFADEGVYPFACNYHPGMTGAIVVGDGKGIGNGALIATAPPTADPPDAAAAAPTADPSSAPWIALAAIGGLLVGVSAAIAGIRRRKPALPA